MHHNQVLLARRAPDQPRTGYWEYPRGKLKPGETPEVAIKREIAEEFRVTTSVGELFMETTHDYGAGQLRLLAYWCALDHGNPDPQMHDAIAWVSLPDLIGYDLLPADVPIAHALAALNPEDVPGYLELEPETVLSSKGLAAMFACSEQGGTRRSRTTNALVLISPPSRPPTWTSGTGRPCSTPSWGCGGPNAGLHAEQVTPQPPHEWGGRVLVRSARAKSLHVHRARLPRWRAEPSASRGCGWLTCATIASGVTLLV